MIKTREIENGIIIPVRVQPNSSKERIMGEYDGLLKIAVTQPPERGKANRAIVKVLAKYLNVKSSDVLLMSGDKSKDKEVFVRNITKKDVENLCTQSA